MPIVIKNSAVGRISSSRSKENDDNVEFRTRTLYIGSTSKTRTSNIKSCGRDAVINKPYRPLGSMDSVLGLEIIKSEKPARSLLSRNTPNSQRTITDHKPKATVKNGNVEPEKVPASQLAEELEYRQEIDSNTLGRKIWLLRKKRTKEMLQANALGYKEILTKLKGCNSRVKTVKAGAPLANFIQPRGPLECASWGVKRTMNRVNEVSTEDITERKDDHVTSPGVGNEAGEEATRKVLKQKSNNFGKGPKQKAVDRLREGFDQIVPTKAKKARNPHPPENNSKQPVSRLRQTGRKLKTRPNVSRSKTTNGAPLENEKGKQTEQKARNMTKLKSTQRATGIPVQSIESIPGATVIAEAHKKKLPSYVLSYPRNRDAEHDRIKNLATMIRQNQENQTTHVIPVPNTGDDEQLETRTRGAVRFERLHKKILSRIRDASNASDAIQQAILQRTKEFCKTQTSLDMHLTRKMDVVEFERINKYRLKFVALDLALNNNTGVSESELRVNKFDQQKQLGTIRTMSKDLKTIQKEHNLGSSVWFTTLLNKCKETNAPPSLGERKFLAAFRQLILEGYMLTPELFQDVLLHVIDREDHKLANVQRLIGLIRDNVLQMSLSQYHKFLKGNNLYIPRSLLERIEEEELAKHKSSHSKLRAGMRAATFALKWRRQTRQNILSHEDQNNE